MCVTVFAGTFFKENVSFSVGKFNIMYVMLLGRSRAGRDIVEIRGQCEPNPTNASGHPKRR